MLAALLLAALGGPLAPFDAYVGHCWVTDLPAGSTDRHCFATAYDGAHVRDTHVVTRNGKPVYAGETLYSAQDGRIVLTYWNSLGGVGHGTGGVAEDGAMTFDLAMRATPTAGPQRFVTIWRRTTTGYDTTAGGTIRRFRLAD